jgi:DNA-binding NarL/FixJ family response regulator
MVFCVGIGYPEHRMHGGNIQIVEKGSLVDEIKVFVADDSPVIRERLAAMIDELAGANLVGQAATVLQAIEGIQELAPDVVILDIRMPPEGKSGWDVLQAVKPDPAIGPLVIVLTQYLYPAYREKSLALGANYFFDKTTEFDRVLEVIGGLGQR